ncbi:Sensor protein qseC [Achromobacter denitrificans]|uniref:ATP-binding protein n=1 Tax=Achromobacter denitrificans TaxID=32002 RepID=UPI0007870731|nr:ATP-binding protein [Achromobacter denitrificans]MDF3941773.1 ATP-binding protein [Achromobacter denitrificans]OLU01738.1 sensor histidine kinase [Achromobacter denitrificans]QKH41586.1 sensor histidine kinase N-terminal domain-containing protein [Achromobacter denitrificans]QKH51271.1 sensor histidine kinase N-terminal domain-containing protein [Achromobacter denitrificans]CAB3742330.1 Sensor protein QseC [Achromobacter denitrificans]
MKTLRRQLTLTLLLTLLLAWIAVFAFQQYETSRAQTGVRDQWLRDAADQILAALPVSLLGSVAPTERFAPPASGRVDGDRIRFQLWSLADRRLLLRSPESPAQPLSGGFAEGYADVAADGADWRAFALTDASGRVQVQVTKPMSEWRESWYSLKRGLLIVSLLFVLLAAVSCAVVGRAFRKVDRAGEAISRRGPFDLAPLPSAGMPGELRPFIHSINQLLLRVKGGMDRERRFLEDAAHELRTPLAALSAHAELVERSLGGGDAAASVEKLRRVAQRTSRLSEQLLDQARMDALSASADEPVPIELDGLVVLLARDWEGDATRKRQRIQLDVQACVVQGRLDAIGVLVRNLLDNAVRYTPEDGQIAVSCGPSADGGAFLRVADDGPGIAPAERERVFDRFYRAAGTAGGGSGIGLSLVAQIAAQHGAEVAMGTGLRGAGVALTVSFPPAGA